MKWVKLTLLTLKQCLFSWNIPLELLINTAPPLQTASTTRISWENALTTDNSLATMWRSSLWNDFACTWTGFNSPLRHFFLSFFPLFGRFVFAFLTIKYLLPSDMFSLFMHSAGPLWLREVLPVKLISSLTLKRTNSLRVERLQRGIDTKFCSNSVQSNHSGNKILINCWVIDCLPFSMGKPVAPRFRQMVRKIQDW